MSDCKISIAAEDYDALRRAHELLHVLADEMQAACGTDGGARQGEAQLLCFLGSVEVRRTTALRAAREALGPDDLREPTSDDETGWKT